MSKDETGIWNFSLFIIPMLHDLVCRYYQYEVSKKVCCPLLFQEI